MAHGITSADSMFSVRRVPWHGLGAVLERRPSSLEEAIALAGLDWQVDQHPVLHETADGPVLIDDVRANVRRDTGAVLGVVSDDYAVVQNEAALGFLTGLIGSELHFETAGSLWGGRAVWALAELPDNMEIGGDAVRRFVLVTTRHDGTAAVRARVTPMRVVCQNTLTAALAGAGSDTYRVRHLGDAQLALDEGRRMLGLAARRFEQFAALGDRLAGQRMTERELARMLDELYPANTALGGRAARNERERRDAVLALFLHGETVGNAPGSRWCAWNAIVEQHDFGGRARTPQGTFLRRFEDAAGIKARALELVAAA
jgi:phage/plasmid-like protein (TIGR03299 family)